MSMQAIGETQVAGFDRSAEACRTRTAAFPDDLLGPGRVRRLVFDRSGDRFLAEGRVVGTAGPGFSASSSVSGQVGSGRCGDGRSWSGLVDLAMTVGPGARWVSGSLSALTVPVWMMASLQMWMGLAPCQAAATASISTSQASSKMPVMITVSAG